MLTNNDLQVLADLVHQERCMMNGVSQYHKRRSPDLARDADDRRMKLSELASRIDREMDTRNEGEA